MFVDGGELWIYSIGTERSRPRRGDTPVSPILPDEEPWHAADRCAAAIGADPAALLRLGMLDAVPEPTGDVVDPVRRRGQGRLRTATRSGASGRRCACPCAPRASPACSRSEWWSLHGAETWVTVGHFGPVKLAGGRASDRRAVARTTVSRVGRSGASGAIISLSVSRQSTRSSDMTKHNTELESIARHVVAPGKGILAADEATGTIKKRFDSIRSSRPRRTGAPIASCSSLPPAASSSSAASSSTTRPCAKATTAPSPRCSPQKGILPGIKVDKGAKPLALPAKRSPKAWTACASAGRVLRARRALRQVARRHRHRRDRHPQRPGMDANAHALARYAALARERASSRSSSPRC